MKPRTFAVGQRVAVYNNAIRYVGAVECIQDNGEVCVRLDNAQWINVHPRQCVRLIKKAKPEPREWDLAMPTMDSIWRPIVMGVGTASVGGEVRTADGDGRWTIAEVIRVREVIKHRGQHGEK